MFFGQLRLEVLDFTLRALAIDLEEAGLRAQLFEVLVRQRLLLAHVLLGFDRLDRGQFLFLQLGGRVPK